MQKAKGKRQKDTPACALLFALCLLPFAFLLAADKKLTQQYTRVYQCPIRGVVTDAAISPDDHWVAVGSMIPQGTQSVEESVRLFELRRDCPSSARLPEPPGMLNNDRRRLPRVISG